MIRIVLALLLAMTSCSFAVAADIPLGKKSLPGRVAPGNVNPDEAEIRSQSIAGRDPFKQPTEVLPSDCPPSRPLCKFDYSQLKVVGVIQTSDGPYRALVEDPDGRGHYVASGQMIGTATVTQISHEGIWLRLHRGSRDVVLPLYHSEKES